MQMQEGEELAPSTYQKGEEEDPPAPRRNHTRIHLIPRKEEGGYRICHHYSFHDHVDAPKLSIPYYVTDVRRWGVSNVGYFSEINNSQYTYASSSPFSNTLDSELFQTARISASSLRYYGLGLENGKYTVLLQFAESAIENGNTWKSLGRRVFDVYIQGIRVLQDFDIRKEAGGISFRAIPKSFNTTVSENYLEIHLHWAGKQIPGFMVPILT